MSLSTSSPPLPLRSQERQLEVLVAFLAGFAAYDLALAVFMAAAPHAFYEAIGPFGPANDHYIRDNATFSAALGVGFLIAIRRPAWRVPVIAITLIQFALHSLNHLVDIGDAHPAWTGYFDFVALTATTLLLVWLLRVALAREARAIDPTSKGGSP